jgi:hypothetical protein
MKNLLLLAFVSILTTMACKQDTKSTVNGDAVAAASPEYVAMRNAYNTAMKNMEQVHEMQLQFRAKSKKLSEESNMQTSDPNTQYTLSQLNKAENVIALWAQQYNKVRLDTMKTDIQKQLFLANGAVEINDANTQINLALEVCKKALAGETVAPAEK